jgi:hypothetical protein
MNSPITMLAARWPLAATISLLLALSACSSKEAAAPAAEPKAETTGEGGLVLEKEQIEKLGVQTQAAKPATYAAEISGFGQVVGHESVALMTAEIATASAAAHQSHAALVRLQHLAGTPGAFGADAMETAERQAAADAAALGLAQQKLTAALGQSGPLNGEGGRALLGELASGRAKLVRATFPSGSLGAGTPPRLRVAPFEAGARTRDWTTTTIWNAPADAAIPGRSLFALLVGSDVSEGERVQVWATAGSAKSSGVLVPASAVVLQNDSYWCYVEKPAGSFHRVAMDVSHPLSDGYFVAAGVVAGDAIVTSAAGLLLAREINPSTEAE